MMMMMMAVVVMVVALSLLLISGYMILIILFFEGEGVFSFFNFFLPGAETEENKVKTLGAQFDQTLHFDDRY